MTRRDPAVRADPVILVDRVIPVHPMTTAQADPAAQADLANMARAVRVDRANLANMARADPVVRADPATTTQADPVVLGTTQADPVVLGTTRVDPVVLGTTRVDPAAHGMEIPNVAISTTPHGVTDPHLGGRARRRGRTGTDRFHPPAGSGGTARSTTGVTRKRPFGTPGSTRGASGSSGSGSRCKKDSPHGARLATRRGGRRPVHAFPKLN
jgi:hypothetical protein